MNLNEDFVVPSEDVKKIVQALKEHSSYDFSDYSEKSIRRRIDKIFNDYKQSVSEIITNISKNPGYVDKLVSNLIENK